MKLGQIIGAFKNSVCTSQKAHLITITRTTQLMLFREIIALCSENHTEHVNTVCVWRIAEEF
jgi:hypothetical protein